MCGGCGSGGGLRRPYFRNGSANPNGKLMRSALKPAGKRRGRAAPHRTQAKALATKVKALSAGDQARVGAVLKKLQRMLAK